MDIIKELITPLFAFLGVLATAYFAYRSDTFKKQSRTLQGQKETAERNERKAKVELSALQVLFETTYFSFLEDKVSEIFENTKANRFLILFAINGTEKFKYATVVYEHMKDDRSKGAIKRYVKVEIDDYYQDMLKVVEKEGSVHLVVKDMPDKSLLKAFYKMPQENVKYSIIKFITRIKVDSMNDIVFYSSIATCDDDDFELSERVFIKVIFDQIRHHKHQIKIT